MDKTFTERYEWECEECGKPIDLRYRDEYEEVEQPDGSTKFLCCECYE